MFDSKQCWFLFTFGQLGFSYDLTHFIWMTSCNGLLAGHCNRIHLVKHLLKILQASLDLFFRWFFTDSTMGKSPWKKTPFGGYVFFFTFSKHRTLSKSKHLFQLITGIRFKKILQASTFIKNTKRAQDSEMPLGNQAFVTWNDSTFVVLWGTGWFGWDFLLWKGLGYLGDPHFQTTGPKNTPIYPLL